MLRSAIKTFSKLSICSLVLAVVLSVGANSSRADEMTADEFHALLAYELLINEGIDVSQLDPDDAAMVEVLWIYVDSVLGIIPPENQAAVDELHAYYMSVYGF